MSRLPLVGPRMARALEDAWDAIRTVDAEIEQLTDAREFMQVRGELHDRLVEIVQALRHLDRREFQERQTRCGEPVSPHPWRNW